MFRPHGKIAPAILCILLCAAPALAVDKGLDLIPEDAAFGLVIHSLAGLRDRGDKFVDEHHIKLPRKNRFSSLFRRVFAELNIKKGLDEKGSAAVLLANLKKMGVEEMSLAALSYIVLAVPFTDLDQMAANFDLKAGTLKPGKVHELEGEQPFIKAVLVKGKHVYLGMKGKALNWVARSKPVTKVLSRSQRSVLSKADIAVHFGPEAWGLMWKDSLRDLEKQLLREGDQGDKDISRQFVEALGQVRFVVAGISLDKAPRLDVIASFPRAKDNAATKFLTALRAGPGASDLIGLPAADPLLAYAARGDGRSNVTMVRALINILFSRTSDIDKLLPSAERQQFLGAMGVMYTHLKGSRAAFYRTGNKSGKGGELAGVAILDVDAPDTFLGQMPKMVQVANKAGPKAAEEAGLPAPRFTYKARAETLDGARVDVLTVEVPKLEEGQARELRQLFGKDWNRLLLVVQGKKVVLLLGSDRTLLRETLRNLKQGSKGLAGNKVVAATLARLAPERKLEFHVNLKRFLPLVTKGMTTKLGGTVKGLTSFALTVEPDRMHFEIVAASSEVKSFAEAIGF